MGESYGTIMLTPPAIGSSLLDLYNELKSELDQAVEDGLMIRYDPPEYYLSYDTLPNITDEKWKELLNYLMGKKYSILFPDNVFCTRF